MLLYAHLPYMPSSSFQAKVRQQTYNANSLSRGTITCYLLLPIKSMNRQVSMNDGHSETSFLCLLKEAKY